MAFVVSIIGAVAMLPFFNISSEGETSFDFAELFNMILGILPSNFFAPFVEGNPLQIIFVAGCIGISMLISMP